jgi:hypothetical protein
MKFTHDGNKTHVDGLVNFEKMHMLAQTMRTLRYCRARHLGETVARVSAHAAGGAVVMSFAVTGERQRAGSERGIPSSHDTRRAGFRS